RLFGTSQQRTLAKYDRIVAQINAQEQKLQGLSDEEVRAKTIEFKERLKKGESLDSLLPEAYAVVKNVCRRLVGTEVHVSGYNQKWDMVPYDVQLKGGIALHQGYIAEMQTGEGKTLTASMPLYLNALTGKPVHIVTVNDYLAFRDCEWVGSIFRWLGLTTGVITQELPYEERQEIYQKDIVYGTASEFGFDYLRDNSVSMRKDELVQRGHYFALIDEVDSILIDEARTPLIISGPSAANKQLYAVLKDSVSMLVQKQRDLCSRLATEAKKKLDAHATDEAIDEKNLSEDEQNALRTMWLVSKGMPRHKILKRLREDPAMRQAIDKWDLYFYGEQNKEERAKFMADLFIIVDEKANEYELTDKGIAAWQECGGKEDDFVMLDLGHEFLLIDQDPTLSEEEKMKKKVEIQDEDGLRKERSHNLRQLLRAHLLMEQDVDYIVQDDKIIIIDENTGRPQPGRRFSDGLHQAIEAKEGVSIQKETQTFATITLQNYFRMYTKLAGMTGTAITEAHELKEIYKIDVLQIPTYKECIRTDANDEMYMTEREKYNAILKEVREIHAKGCPILLGTESVEVSEKLARILKLNHLEHTVLNAKNHAKEAEIISMAGQRGAITIATNMAGRGTDIKLGEGIAALGGLHVIGSTRHQSRRIDRQLRGRSARQGDPGASKFFISLEDPLMRLFASPSLTALLAKFRPPEGEPISAPILNRSIETAQKRIEGRNYTIRKHTLEYDDVMNKQRQEIYSFRNDLLHTEDSFALAEDMIGSMLDMGAEIYFKNRSKDWNPEGFRQWLSECTPVSFEPGFFDDDRLDTKEIVARAEEKILAEFRHKIEREKEKAAQLIQHPDFDANKIISDAMRNIMVRTIDNLWQEHLLAMDHLRSDVSLRAVGQKDPLMEFKHEAFNLFEQLTLKLKENMSRTLFKFEMFPSHIFQGHRMTPEELLLETDRSLVSDIEEEEDVYEEEHESNGDSEVDLPVQPISVGPKVGRNDDCPCGSGKKYKKCCGVNKDELVKS
ncbi:MAG: preprotein translocase subunit SecA, partial [Verrucomicrobia bacterium]|nr:preprotein translocase subunit SecA [Verrucomicrobiota bacterium]